jgi:hypothetical protein
VLSSSPRRGGDSDCLQGKLGLKLHAKMIQNGVVPIFAMFKLGTPAVAVSYTHMTLPTILSV